MPTNAESFFQSLPTATEIEQLIGKSEDLYFDAKSVNNENFAGDADKGPLAKAISAFANADGGVIVYGLEARRDVEGKDVVQTAKPLKDAESVRSRILALAGQLVQPPVEAILVEARVTSGSGGYVVVLVPPSDSGPHRAKVSHEYFRRHGSSSLPMEHYELEEMFGRRRRPKLELYWTIKDSIWKEDPLNPAAAIYIGLKNTGRAIAKYPGLVLKRCKTWRWGTDGNGNWSLPVLPPSEPGELRYGASSDRVIYAGMSLDVAVILHPIRLPRKVGEKSIDCDDLVVDYEIYAEDMPTAATTLRVPSDEIIRQMTSR